MSGGQIELVSLSKRFVEMAVDDVDLLVSSGEFFSLLGPSGCGKTTTLRLIAGFEQPTSGKVLLDGVDVSNVPPNKRNVNTVFQSYALFPFLSVSDNVAFGLRNRGLDKAAIRKRVGDVLELVRMTSYEKRRPGQLSGGQQQRVALARALVLDPAVLLLDEPLGALDAKLRRSLKVELKALQERVGITFLYVTHDQEEALTMSDRLAVMRAGKIVQMGAPQSIYDEPADTYVADFLGVSNLMEVDVIERGPGSRCKVRLGESVLSADFGGEDAPDRAHAVIRPERVRIEPFDSGSGSGSGGSGSAGGGLAGGGSAGGGSAGSGSPGSGSAGWLGRQWRAEPGSRHGGAAGLPGFGHPGDAAAGAGHAGAGSGAERRQPGTPVAGHAGPGPPGARCAAGAGR